MDLPLVKVETVQGIKKRVQGKKNIAARMAPVAITTMTGQNPKRLMEQSSDSDPSLTNKEVLPFSVAISKLNLVAE
jgi:hypothetical protein